MENPSVVEAAYLANHRHAIVCTSGWPSTETQRLLELATAQGVELEYAGDYDAEGLAIATFMATRHRARILMTETAYRDADHARAPRWPEHVPVPETPWDPPLAGSLRRPPLSLSGPGPFDLDHQIPSRRTGQVSLHIS